MELFRRNHKPKTEISTIEVVPTPVQVVEEINLDSEDISRIQMTFDELLSDNVWFVFKDPDTGHRATWGFSKDDFKKKPEFLDGIILESKQKFRRYSVNLKRYGAI